MHHFAVVRFSGSPHHDIAKGRLRRQSPRALDWNEHASVHVDGALRPVDSCHHSVHARVLEPHRLPNDGTLTDATRARAAPSPQQRNLDRTPPRGRSRPYRSTASRRAPTRTALPGASGAPTRRSRRLRRRSSPWSLSSLRGSPGAASPKPTHINRGEPCSLSASRSGGLRLFGECLPKAFIKVT